jgi:3'(2'), 5'-bisphosphate nucleotidase
MQNRSNWLVTATASALAAGRAILEVYESPDMGVQKKADDSPLTLADRRAHDIIMAGIGGFGIPVLSEEGRNIPFAERSHGRACGSSIRWTAPRSSSSATGNLR